MTPLTAEEKETLSKPCDICEVHSQGVCYIHEMQCCVKIQLGIFRIESGKPVYVGL